jgi:hypothetical protein
MVCLSFVGVSVACWYYEPARVTVQSNLYKQRGYGRRNVCFVKRDFPVISELYSFHRYLIV